jgi:hypothetical protein
VAINIILVIAIVVYIIFRVRKKKNEFDDMPLVDYDIVDDET